MVSQSSQAGVRFDASSRPRRRAIRYILEGTIRFKNPSKRAREFVDAVGALPMAAAFKPLFFKVDTTLGGV
jgi:hypothetical protein